MSLYFWLFLYVFIGLLAAFFLLFVVGGLKNKGRFARSLNMVLLRVSVPRDASEDEKKKPDKERIAPMEQIYSAIQSLKGKRKLREIFYPVPYVSFEIVGFNKEIIFYASVPRRLEESIVKQINGIYPEAEVQLVNDYNIFNPGDSIAGSSVLLMKNYVLPVKTYQTQERDPLGEIISALEKLQENENAAMQIIIKPTSQLWRKKSLKISRKMQEGKTFERAKAETKPNILRAIQETKKKPQNEAQKQPPRITPGQEEVIKAIDSKTQKIGFEVNIRLITSVAAKYRADELLQQLESAFSQFNAPHINSFKFKNENKKIKKLIFDFSFRNFNKKKRILLNSEELSSVFHFPLPGTSSSKIKWLKARGAPAPSNIPEHGLVLGKNNYRAEQKTIRISKEDRRRHLYIIGQTGTGKSVFLQEMIKQDIRNGEGIALLDPHGDLVESVLGSIPPERSEDVVYFNPFDMERVMGLNMLEFETGHPEQKTFIANEMIGIFQKLYGAVPEALGPMFEQYMRNALLLVMEDPDSGSTLLEVPKVMADADFRHYKLSKCGNIVVKDFWEKEAEKAGGEAALANMTPYITSKMNMFLANEIMRPIISQQKSAFDFREIMDKKKILIVNLAKGKLGDINSHLLGLIIVGKLLMAALSRTDIPQEQRADFYLYMDEFQNFTTDSIATILSEARKYRLDLIIAHQYIGQLEEKIRDAVFGNVGNLISFRVGASDAEFLVKQFEPTFTQYDLVNISNFNSIIKLLVEGQTSPAFNMQTYPPTPSSAETSSTVKELSRLKYGRPKMDVEREISQRASFSRIIDRGGAPETEYGN